jgi:hypothetical protein
MTRNGERDEVDAFISWISASDPLRDSGVRGWSDGQEAGAMFRSIVDGDRSSGREVAALVRPGPRRRRPVILVLAVLIAGGGVAGADVLLGGPAPEDVKQDLRDLDRGIPADLRYAPDVEDAHLVAQTAGIKLYAATMTDGGYCSEIALPGRGPAGAVCTPGATLETLPIEVTVPSVDPLTTASPIVVGGRVNAPGEAALLVEFEDGSLQSIPLGVDGFFVFAVTADHLAQAHRHGMTIVASNADGGEVATAQIPPTDFSDASEQDAKQPIFVSTISMQDDLTQVLGIEGSVNVRGAESLELRYPDGTVVDIPLTADGHYRFDLPARRTRDLFEQPGVLVARDASGKELATAPVAAVAYWRGTR